MSDEMAGEVRYLGDVQRLALQPDDIVVLSASSPLSEVAYERILAMMQRFFPAHKILLLDKDLRLGVLSPNGQELV